MTNWYSKIEKMGKGMVADAMDEIEDSFLELPSPSLNWALGGGLVFGKKITVYGPESAGKSLIAQMAVAALHASDPEAWAIWYDSEFSFDKAYARKLGIDTERLWVVQSNKPSEVFDHFYDEVWPMIQDGFPLKIFVLDSIKALRGPKEVATESVENHVMGDMSQLLNKAFRKIAEPIYKVKVLAIFVQQVNEEMDRTRQMQGHKWHVPSGQSMKHGSDWMVLVEKVNVKKMKTFDEDHKNMNNMPIQVGHKIRCKVEKNRVKGAPNLVAEFQLKYGVGIVNVSQEIAEMAVNLNVVKRPSKISYEFDGEKATGFAKFVELVDSKPELQRKLLKAMNDYRDNKLFTKQVTEVVISEKEDVEDIV